MKKTSLILLFTLIQIIGFAQEVQILFKDDNEIISFANVLYHKHDTLLRADYANVFGIVQLNPPQGATHVSFTSLGYKTLKTSLSAVADTVYLEEDITELETIVLKPTNKKNKKIKKINWGFPVKFKACLYSSSTGFEAIAFIENELKKSKKIISFSFFLKKYQGMESINDKLCFRLVVYSHKNKVPDKAYMRDSKDNIFMIQGHQEGKIKLDVANLQLSIPADGIFIGLEYIGHIKENTQDIIFTNERQNLLSQIPCISFLISKLPNAKYTHIRYKYDKNQNGWNNLAIDKARIFPFLSENQYIVPAFAIEVKD